VARSGEASDWSPRLPSVAGVISNFNTLDGLDRLPAARTLEVTPYVAVIEQRSPASSRDPFASVGATRLSAGADIMAGYTHDGWSIGVLNAVTERVEGQFTDSLSDVRHATALEPEVSYTVARNAHGEMS
jgi:hypothetical protein